jgi:predicted O-methyltransferase YrrM
MEFSRRARRAFSLGKFLVETSRHNGAYTTESAVDHVFSCDSAIPVQKRRELIELARIVRAQRPRTMLEIGSATGGTLFVLCQMADPQATIVSNDLQSADFGAVMERIESRPVHGAHSYRGVK